MNTKEKLMEKIEETLVQILNEGLPILSKKSINRLSALLTSEVERIIGEDEKVGLPVTQAQEQKNYDKKQRNQLRAEQRKALSELKGGKDEKI